MPGQSETLAALAAALAKFQGQVESATKNATNPHLRNKYADLASIWEAIREPLAGNGLSVVQLPAPGENGTLKLHTRLMHESGEWIEGEIQMPLGKQDPQGYGSALTYARRYGLAALLGITQEDDDAEGATKRDTKPAATQQQTPVQQTGVNEAQIKRLFAIARKHNVSNDQVKELMDFNFGITSTKDLTREQYDALCDELIPAFRQLEEAVV